MNSLKRSIRFLSIDMKQSLAWFWGVMLLIDIASYVLMSIYDNRYFGISNSQTISVAGANMMPIFIFFIIYVYTTYYEDFPLALGFSITRKDFFKAFILDNIIVGLLFSIIQTILMKADIGMIIRLGLEPMVDFGFFNIASDSSIFIVISLFTLLLALTSIMNLIASLNYRFGYKFWITIGIIFSITSIFLGVAYFGFIEMIFAWRIDMTKLLVLGLTIIAMYFLSYLVVINTNIKSKTS